jgi:integrase/recombinase XerC
MMTAPLSTADGLAAAQASVLITDFLRGRSETTMRAYRQDFEAFRRFTGAETLDGAGALLLSRGQGAANALAHSYRTHLLERGLAPSTVNRRLAALRSLVKMARLFGVVTWSLETPGVHSQTYRDTRGPGRDGFRSLLAAQGDTTTPALLRDRAILRLLYDLGLRRGEVVSLDIADVDLAAGIVQVVGKGRREKTPLTLASPTRQALVAWLAARGNAPGPLFTSFDRARKGDGRLTDNYVYRMVRALGEKAGVRARPHGLRHTAITEACKAAQAAGIGLEEVLDFSRHKDVKVLMVYRDRERDVQGKLASLVADDV